MESSELFTAQNIVIGAGIIVGIFLLARVAFGMGRRGGSSSGSSGSGGRRGGGGGSGDIKI